MYEFEELIELLPLKDSPVDFLYYCVKENRITKDTFYSAFYWLAGYETMKALKQL